MGAREDDDSPGARPDDCADVAEMERWASEEAEDASNKGTKRKRPLTKGPCEHGIKYRSQCKVCGACDRKWRRVQECNGCPHGRLRSRCKECGGGLKSAALDSQRSVQGNAVGLGSASTVVSATCRECGGSQSASTVVGALCRVHGGASICEHGRIRSRCKECGGSQISRTVVSALMQGVRWGWICGTVVTLCMQGVRWVTKSATAVK